MLSLLLALAVGAPDWTDYRGPGRDGHADGAELPTAWSEEENVAWKTPIHGRGWSSPVLLEGRAWLTTAPPTGDTLSVLAVAAVVRSRAAERDAERAAAIELDLLAAGRPLTPIIYGAVPY